MVKGPEVWTAAVLILQSDGRMRLSLALAKTEGEAKGSAKMGIASGESILCDASLHGTWELVGAENG